MTARGQTISETLYIFRDEVWKLVIIKQCIEFGSDHYFLALTINIHFNSNTDITKYLVNIEHIRSNLVEICEIVSKLS